jgi:chromosome segregation protein
LYLKRLSIHGFKTFAERTEIEFPPGITCVIGPNGSGKSNISDAILWVLGENNARSLRGQTFQDIIFAGNERRRPVGMAEVALTIDNTARILPLDFSEITVTRRVYRSGDAECFINKVACRLRDLYELFLDTGVGRDAYALINQGQIDQILSVRADERRAVFEEAAGVTKYRVRKREAERKLEQTQQNLSRVRDIAAEIEVQLGPLQRQAAAAVRWRELSARLHELEDAWFGTRVRRLTAQKASLTSLSRELRDELARLDADLRVHQAEEQAADAQLRESDARLDVARSEEREALRRAVELEAEKARRGAQDEELQRRISEVAQELDELRVKIEQQVARATQVVRDESTVRKQVDSVRSELVWAEAQARELQQQAETAADTLAKRRKEWLEGARLRMETEVRLHGLERRAVGLSEELERARSAAVEGDAALSALETDAHGATATVSQAEPQLAELRQKVQSGKEVVGRIELEAADLRKTAVEADRARSSLHVRLQTLLELGQRGEGAAAGARALLRAAAQGELAGNWMLLAEGMELPQGLERAAEAALGIYADAVVCESPEHGQAALTWLQGRKHSAVLLPGPPSETAEPIPGSLGSLVAAAGTRARERSATLSEQWQRVILARSVVVDSLSPQPDVAAGDPALRPELWVTREGTWRLASGAMGCGNPGADSAEGAAAAVAISRANEVARLHTELPQLTASAEQATMRVADAEERLHRARAQVAETQVELERVRIEHQAAVREAERRVQDLQRARREQGRRSSELARLQAEQEAVADTLAKARERLKALLLPTASELDPTGAGSSPPVADQPEADPEVNRAQQAATAAEAARRGAESTVSQLRVSLSAEEARLREVSGQVRRLTESGAQLDKQRADRLREEQRLTGERDQQTLSFELVVRELSELRGAAEREAATIAELSALRTEALRALGELRTRVQGTTARHRELTERLHRAQVELSSTATQREHAVRQWLESAQSRQSAEAVDGDDCEDPITVEAIEAGWDPRAAERLLSACLDPEGEIARLRRQLRALGPVNLEAVEQLAAAQERHTFLTDQIADLETSREQLETVIAELDAASRNTFLRAFQEIAAAFDEMFKKLFGGGATELKLTDPDDVLASGIEILVQAPGKRQQNLLLLSGGERALTATAMLFALLKVRPSPFCVLDEVDAPLDETNVGRFRETLREFTKSTQFIVVTHNRGTMEGADVLYGVTMQERGISKVLSCTLTDPVVAQVEHERSAAAGRAGRVA